MTGENVGTNEPFGGGFSEFSISKHSFIPLFYFVFYL